MSANGKMKGYLPVHCCCEPGKRFGWVRVWSEKQGPVSFAISPTFRVVRDPLRIGIEGPINLILTFIGDLQLADGTRLLAVSSADVPLETWRKVAGFIECRDGMAQDNGRYGT